MKFDYIVIEREYASGGTEIGEKAAEMLDIKCYGQEIPKQTAERIGMPFERVLELEENPTGSLLYSLSRMASYVANGKDVYDFEAILLEEMETIRKISGNGPAVFVGRSGAKALDDKDKVLKVFIRASMEDREKRGTKIYKVCKSEIKDVIKKHDKRRSNFYRENFGKDWKKYDSYDIVLDSGILGIEKCAAIIAEAAK